MNFRLGYRPALDGLRAIFVLMVMASHTEMPFFRGGGLGVTGFFVLSGFLITSILVRERNDTGGINLKAFYARRALRLFPALFVLLAACAVCTIAFSTGAKADAYWQGIGWALAYVSNWPLAIYDELTAWIGLLGHTWSLAVEEQFYLTWPLILVALLSLKMKRRWLVGAALLLALASAIWRLVLYSNDVAVARLYYGTDTRAEALLIGCALGLLFSTGTVPIPTTPLARRVMRAASFCSLVILGSFFIGVPSMNPSSYTVIAIAVTILIYHVVAESG